MEHVVYGTRYEIEWRELVLTAKEWAKLIRSSRRCSLIDVYSGERWVIRKMTVAEQQSVDELERSRP